MLYINSFPFLTPVTFFFLFVRPQFKRLAALLGDMTFQAPRRFLLEIASKTQPAYSFRTLTARPRQLLLLSTHELKLRIFAKSSDSRTRCITRIWCTGILRVGYFHGLYRRGCHQYVEIFDHFFVSHTELQQYYSLLCPYAQSECSWKLDKPSPEHFMGQMVIVLR